MKRKEINGGIMVQFHIVLKRLRTERKLTQTALAKRLGVTNAMVSAYESGERYPSFNVLIRLADAFSVSMDTLFGFENASYINVSDLEPHQIAAVTTIIDELKRLSSTAK